MRRWQTYVLVFLLVMVLVGAPVQAGGIVDFGSGFEALTPFFIVNAILTAITSVLFVQGCTAVNTTVGT